MHRALVTAGVRAFFSGSRWLTEKGVSYGVLSAACGTASRLAHFLGLVLLLCSAGAYAFNVPVTWNAKLPSAGGGALLTGFSTATAACSAAIAAYDAFAGTNSAGFAPSITGSTCNKWKSGVGTVGPIATLSQVSACPANSAGSGGTCTCNTGYEYDAPTGSCMAVDEKYCKDRIDWESAIGGGGSIGGPEAWYSGQLSSGVFCDTDNYSPPGGAPGCIVGFEMGMRIQVDGKWRTSGRAYKLGFGPYACSPTDPVIDPPKDPVEPTKPEGCKPPQVAGMVNGQSTCYTPSPNDPRQTGPETRTTTETVDNGDGTRTTTTRTTTTQTTCTGGSCNTTTTTTTNVTTTNISTGATISNTTNTTNGGTTNPLTGFCKENPKSPLCVGDEGDDGGKSQFGGSCGGGFQCKGDAIQCAMAKEQHIRNCKAFEPQGTAEEGLYDDAKGKAGTNQSGDNSNNETIDLNTTLDTSDAIGGGTGGMSDLTVTVWKRPITLPFSIVNQYLGYLGNLLVAISFLVAFRIVTRG